jgi:hypothetical protein
MLRRVLGFLDNCGRLGNEATERAEFCALGIVGSLRLMDSRLCCFVFFAMNSLLSFFFDWDLKNDLCLVRRWHH